MKNGKIAYILLLCSITTIIVKVGLAQYSSQHPSEINLDSTDFPGYTLMTERIYGSPTEIANFVTVSPPLTWSSLGFEIGSYRAFTNEGDMILTSVYRFSSVQGAKSYQDNLHENLEDQIPLAEKIGDESFAKQIPNSFYVILVRKANFHISAVAYSFSEAKEYAQAMTSKIDLSAAPSNSSQDGTSFPLEIFLIIALLIVSVITIAIVIVKRKRSEE